MKKFSVKNMIIINFINLMMLGVLSGTCLIAGLGLPVFAFFMVIWFAYVILINRKILLVDTDSYQSLRNADKKHLFENEIAIIIKTAKSIDFYKEVFESYNGSSNVKEAYELLSQKAYNNMQRAETWIRHYDYITCPPTKYLQGIVAECCTIAQKINELDELVLQINNNTLDSENMQQVDDMLEALREVLGHEQQ